jgi:hypothetical protein
MTATIPVALSCTCLKLPTTLIAVSAVWTLAAASPAGRTAEPAAPGALIWPPAPIMTSVQICWPPKVPMSPADMPPRSFSSHSPPKAVRPM